MGGLLIVGGVQYANAEYIDVAEKGGYKLADKIGLKSELRRLLNDDYGFRPTEPVYIHWRDGDLRISYERNNEGIWVVVQKITFNSDGFLGSVEPYIKAGELPLDFREGCPIFQGRK